MKHILLATSLTLATPVFAADNYTVDPRHTFPSFEVSHLGFSIQRGRFDRTSGKITLDPATKSGSIDITVDAGSISTGLADLEKHLRGDEFFDTEKYPVMTFKSKKLNFDGDQLLSADGEFTMHGVTRPLTLTLDRFRCGPNPMTKKPQCGANVLATLKRSDFGISKYVPAVGDEVRIAIQVEATRD